MQQLITRCNKIIESFHEIILLLALFRLIHRLLKVIPTDKILLIYFPKKLINFSMTFLLKKTW